MNTARQIFYEGQVQGVGFRYTVKQIAAGYEVVGWVRNLPDGRVEVQARGEAAEVEAFTKAIATGDLRHHIRDTREGQGCSLEETARGFEIRF